MLTAFSLRHTDDGRVPRAAPSAAMIGLPHDPSGADDGPDHHAATLRIQGPGTLMRSLLARLSQPPHGRLQQRTLRLSSIHNPAMHRPFLCFSLCPALGVSHLCAFHAAPQSPTRTRGWLASSPGDARAPAVHNWCSFSILPADGQALLTAQKAISIALDSGLALPSPILMHRYAHVHPACNSAAFPTARPSIRDAQPTRSDG